jgi:D-tyrosyl-tRNA(Tyr) deacylase
MRVVIQRVKQASVEISGNIHSAIGKGLVRLVGVDEVDEDEDIQYIASKVAALRIFQDEEGKMNKNVVEVGGECLVVSQFTLFASTKKGNRPSFMRSAKPERAVKMYAKFVHELQDKFGVPIQTGEFGADMAVALINDGPVTITMDSRARE